MARESKMIMIAGAYGYGNTGDDAILKHLTVEIRRVIPDLRIVVLSSHPDETSASCDVEAIHWQGHTRDSPNRQNLRSHDDRRWRSVYDYWGVDPDVILTENHAELPYSTGLALVSRLLSKPLMFNDTLTILSESGFGEGC